jgi:hypothetical protein
VLAQAFGVQNIGEKIMRYLIAVLCLIVCSSFMIETGLIPIQPKGEVKVEPIITKVAPATFVTPKADLVKVKQAAPKSTIEFGWHAKLCVSENGFNLEECFKINQTLENMRGGKRSLWQVMSQQAARITRMKPFTDPRQIWVSYLPMDGDDPPTMGWVECKGKNNPKNCTGTWAYVGKQWVAFREKFHDAFYADTIPKLLPGKPIQWGGDMDYWRGAERNFCPLNIGDRFHNTFWGDSQDPINKGFCVPIDKAKIIHSKKLTEDIFHYREMKKESILTLLGKKTEKAKTN